MNRIVTSLIIWTKIQLKHSSEYVILCSIDERNRFATTLRWVNLVARMQPKVQWPDNFQQQNWRQCVCPVSYSPYCNLTKLKCCLWGVGCAHFVMRRSLSVRRPQCVWSPVSPLQLAWHSGRNKLVGRAFGGLSHHAGTI